jgi:hypothetical protein
MRINTDDYCFTYTPIQYKGSITVEKELKRKDELDKITQLLLNILKKRNRLALHF